ncbi:MAG: hypothetical protein N3A68_06805 [Bacteroidia bacterium]|nr:hypothetical protein [Bacteroidia bacterium]GIV22752.1 MAG: hypothetical protein KatS3mg025_0411 [Bacteroidia bacterium]
MNVPTPLLRGGVVALIGVGLFLGCKKEKHDASADSGHDVVTTVELYLVQGSDTVKGRYKDPDGPGGRLPTIDTLRPRGGQGYRYFVRLLNESGNPIEDLTAVITQEQKNTHRLFLLPEPDSIFAFIQPTDSDDMGRPIGAQGTWQQGPDTLREGAVRILLRHYLNPTDKNYGLERGSTDLDVRLPIRLL